MNTPTLGIDFGTTKTLVSYVDPQTGHPKTIRLGRGSDYLPTSVFVEEDGSMVFGDYADDEIEYAAQRYSRGFKMKLGSPVPALGFFDGTQFCKYSARELTRAFLSYIKKECEEHAFMGLSVCRAVITCPVLFSPAQRSELEEAAQQAGFREVHLVTEPEAAGLAFCRLCPETCFKGNALIVDWGGGTLDMALVSRKGERVATYNEYTIGDMEMGGEVFDSRFWLHVASRLRVEHGVDLNLEKPEQQGVLLKRVRQEKEMLTKHEQRRIRLSSSQGACPPLEITRTEFERLIVVDVEKATQLALHLLSSIREASLKPEMLLLVGGTSLVPCIASALEKSVGLPCHKWQYSREAVSLGAALMGYEAALETQKERAKPESPPASIRHTLLLTSQEMRDGCVKSFTLNGVTFEEAIPRGMCQEGLYKRLSGDQAKGLGDIELIIKRIRSGNQDGADWNQKLIDAVLSNRLSVVDSALKHGADTEHKSPDGRTALQIAVKKGQSDMVECLLAAGANPNVLYGDRHSLLMQAACRNNVRNIHALLSHRALINHQDSSGMTALMYAASADSHSSVSALLQYTRIKANLRNKQGETALDIAHKKGNEKVVEILNQYAAREKNSNVKGKQASPSGGATDSSKSAVVHANVHWSYMMDKVPYPFKFDGRTYYLNIPREGDFAFSQIGKHGIIIHVNKVYEGDMYDRTAIPNNATVYTGVPIPGFLREAATSTSDLIHFIRAKLGF